MRRFLLFPIALLLLASCGGKQKQEVSTPSDAEQETSDSTLYGTCASLKGSTLSLVTTMNDTLSIVIGDDDMQETTLIAGGMMKGDRLAVTAHKLDDQLWADQVINLTSLLGHWEGTDRIFTLTEDGNDWRILNGQLLIGKDTFSVYKLTADSLELETPQGIFLYNRH